MLRTELDFPLLLVKMKLFICIISPNSTKIMASRSFMLSYYGFSACKTSPCKKPVHTFRVLFVAIRFPVRCSPFRFLTPSCFAFSVLSLVRDFSYRFYD